MLAGIGLSKNGLLTGAQWQLLEFMRQRGKTIRPRQRHHQQEESHADRDARLSQSSLARRYHLPAKVGEPVVKELIVSFHRAAAT
jgi:hypothetical protein